MIHVCWVLSLNGYVTYVGCIITQRLYISSVVTQFCIKPAIYFVVLLHKV